MATALKSLPKFYGLTAAQYTALTPKDSNTLYFVYDEGVNGVIYRGSHVYGETVSYVSAVPEAANALKGVVYFNTTSGTAYVKSGSEMKPVGVLTVDTIDDSSTDNDKKVPNVGAVKTYVKNKVASLLHFKGVVDTVDYLPTSGNVKGDCYIVREVEATPYQPAKTNVEFVWVLDAATGDGWEELGSTYDFSIFMQKKTSATAGDFAQFDASGDTIDSGKVASAAEVVPASTSANVNSLANEKEVAVSLEAEAQARTTADATKQARDTDAVENNAAKFDANGNTVDAGKTYGSDSDTITSASAANVLATEKAVAAAIGSMGDDKQDKDTDAVEGNAAKFDAYGNTIDSGKKMGGATFEATVSENTLATEKAVQAKLDTKQDKDTDAVTNNVAIFDANGNSVDGGKSQGGASLDVTAEYITVGQVTYPKATGTIVYAEENYYPWSKMGFTVLYTKSENPKVGDTTYTNTGSAETPVMTAGDAISLVEGTAPSTKLATEAAVKEAVDAESSRAKGVEALKLDEITGTNDNILLVAGNGTQVADSGKSISANTTVPASSATSVNKVANELEVAALKETVVADYQLKDKDAVAGNVAVFDAYGNSIDGGKVFGTGTIVTSGADADTLATEEAVVALINQMAWQTVE